MVAVEVAVATEEAQDAVATEVAQEEVPQEVAPEAAQELQERVVPLRLEIE